MSSSPGDLVRFDDDDAVEALSRRQQHEMAQFDTAESGASSSGGAEVAAAIGGGGDDDDDDDAGGGGVEQSAEQKALDERNWTYTAPPRTSKGTWEFYDDEPQRARLFARFSSDFCSGNLAGVTRVAPTKFELQLANDNMGAPWATNNKMWFFFTVTGVPAGTLLSFTLTQVPFCKTYGYGFAPVVSVEPVRPNFQRLASSITFVPAPLPPGVVEKLAKKKATAAAAAAAAAAGAAGSGGAAETGTDSVASSPVTPSATAAKGSVKEKEQDKDPQYCHITFDYCFDAPRFSASPAAAAVLSGEKELVFHFAFGHPYSYQKLQRHISAWCKNFGPDAHIDIPAKQQQQALLEQQQLQQQAGTVSSSPKSGVAASATASSANATTSVASSSSSAPNYVATSAANLALTNPHRFHPVMYRELLTRSLDGNRIDLLTITARPKTSSASDGNSPGGSKAKRASPSSSAAASSVVVKEPRFGPDGCLPLPADENEEDGGAAGKATSERVVPVFPNRRYVLLTARVHPGEVPASHVLHGCIEFLLNTEDPRAAALREHFVFVIVPMVNPDGVVRGNTRADPCGVNLNRMYKDPSRKRHPSVWAIRELLLHLSSAPAAVGNSKGSRLALYVDMHAHANKKGAFFYGNAMPAQQQVENVLFAKLVSLNTQFFGFGDCLFTTGNMYSMGKTGICRDGSGRVVAFLHAGVVHSYTLEVNSFVGPATNAVAPLPQRGEEEKHGGTPCPRYTQQTFQDIGRAILQALLDYHGVNPLSRLNNHDTFRNVAAVRAFIGAALYFDATEQVRKRRNEFVVVASPPSGGDAAASAAADLNAECPITTTHGPRLPLPPCTTTAEIASLLPYMAAANAAGVMHLVRGGASGLLGGGGGPLRQLSSQNRAGSSASRRSSASSSSTAASSATSSPLLACAGSGAAARATRLAVAGRKNSGGAGVAAPLGLPRRTSSMSSRDGQGKQPQQVPLGQRR